MSGNEVKDDLDAEVMFAGVSDDTALWNPEKIGATIAGVLMDIERKAGKYSPEPFPWLTLDVGDGVLTKVAASSWDMQRKLKAEIDKHGGRIQLGATITIEYVGDKTLANGRTAKEYSVSYVPPKGGK